MRASKAKVGSLEDTEDLGEGWGPDSRGLRLAVFLFGLVFFRLVVAF